MDDNIGFSSLGTMALGIVVFAVVAVVGIIILGGLGAATVDCNTYTFNTSTTTGVDACYGCSNASFTYDSAPNNCYWNGNHIFSVNFNANETIAPIGIATGTDVVTCPNGTLVSGTDYSIWNSAGRVNVTDNARSITWANFTSVNDTNVSLYNATYGLGMKSFVNSSFVLFNCTDPTIIYNRSNFNLYYDNGNSHPKIMMLSTGWIEDASVYCYNTSGSLTYSGAGCIGTYQNRTATDYFDMAGPGITAYYLESQIGNGSGGIASYTPALIAVAIGAIFIGLLAGFMGGRRTR